MSSLTAFFTSKFIKVSLALYFGLFFLIWVVSSPVAKHFIAPILAEQQLQLSDEASIRLNPFLMRLTLSNIELLSNRNNKTETVFSLKELTVQVALWQLAFDKIVLSQFSVEEGSLKIRQHPEGVFIAGILIPNDVKKASEKQSASKQQTPQHLAYQLILPKLLLSKFDIEISKENNQQLEKTHRIDIEQFSLSEVKATQTYQKGNLTLTALVDETHLALTANANLASGLGDVHSELSIDDYPLEKLARYIEQLTELKGSLSLSSKQTVTLLEQGLNFRVQNTKITLDKLLLGLAEQNLHLERFEHNLENVEVDLQENNIKHLAGNSNIKLTAAALNQHKSKATIAAFKQLNLADINFTLKQGPSIGIADATLDEFIFSKKASLSDKAAKETKASINKLSEEDGFEIAAQDIVKLPPVVKLKKLTLDSLLIDEKSLKINSIIFDTLTAAVIIKENKDIANLVALNDKDDKTEPLPVNKTVQGIKKQQVISTKDTDLAQTKQGDAFTFSLNELRFINENTLNFTDLSVEPIYLRTFFIDTLELGSLSNNANNKQDKTPFSLIGRSNKYANFNLTGYIQPFANLARYHIEGDFKEFSLPAISSYMKDSTGLIVKTGQLNTALNLTLAGDELDGNVVVLLQALETDLVDSEEAGDLIDQGALPLNMALGMLKDGDGNVELDVQISGSTSDPKFGLSSIVTLITQKAIISATQDYLMTTFVPYANIVSIAITAGEFALKLRFDDLPYQEKQIEPDNKQSAYLKDFIALMQDKEDTRVVICAISTPADINLKNGAEVTDNKAIKRLIKIGEEREHALKDYLIEEGEIESSRILFCKPKIDSTEGAIPRIAISI